MQRGSRKGTAGSAKQKPPGLSHHPRVDVIVLVICVDRLTALLRGAVECHVAQQLHSIRALTVSASLLVPGRLKSIALDAACLRTSYPIHARDVH